MSLMVDAISHAVLPGLAIAFLVSGSRASWPMFLGAAIAGLFTAVVSEIITRRTKVDEQASLGTVFSILFALGLVLIVRSADHVDLDPGCVLYGSIELTPLDTIPIGGFLIPRAVLILGGTLLLNLLVVLVFFKEFSITSFDPALATSLGINARIFHYLLMILVAVTTVAAFESVGSILVIAMLVVPAAAAYLLTNRLSSMIALACLFAVIAAAGGHFLAIAVPPLFGFSDTNTAGSMAVVAGIVFAITTLASPKGMIATLRNRKAKTG
jgi:manganese/zinc/iron transport system permease protein